MTDVTESDTARAKIIRQRNTVMAVLLVAWVVLIFAISIVKMQ